MRGANIAWNAGDLFVLPGGEPALHAAGDADAVLWVVTNEPQLAFENLQAPALRRTHRPNSCTIAPTRSHGRSLCIYEVGRSERSLDRR